MVAAAWRKRNPTDTVLDPFYRPVTLTDKAWYEHVLQRHEDVADERPLVLQTLREPDLITHSDKSDNVEVFYRKIHGWKMMRVVVAFLGNTGTVCTAHFVTRIGRKEVRKHGSLAN